MTHVRRYWFLSLAMIVVAAIISLSVTHLKTSDNKFIYSLETAPAADSAKVMIDSLDPPSQHSLYLNTFDDFLFIAAYSALFFFSFMFVYQIYGSKWLYYAAYIFLIPGVFDVIENTFILHFLRGDYLADYFFIYVVVVWVKWRMAAVGILAAFYALYRMIVK